MTVWLAFHYALGLGGAHRFNDAGEFEDLEVRRALGPIVAPANDEVAAGRRMAVVAKIPALKFKFDEHALPSFRT